MQLTKIYCFWTGDSGSHLSVKNGYLDLPLIHTACALTEHGRWIAGAVSQSADMAVARVCTMAKAKAETMVTGPTEVIATDLSNPEVVAALEKAFSRMP